MADFQSRCDKIFSALNLPEESPLQISSTSDIPEVCKSGEEGDLEGSTSISIPDPGHRRASGDNWRSGVPRNRKRDRTYRRPDYAVNPDKWTKYDLNDDQSSDGVSGMSDGERNRFAAMQFLSELRERKSKESQSLNSVNFMCDDKESGDESSKAIVFKKPSHCPGRKENSNLPSPESPEVKSTWNHAIVLPEHVVGIKVEKKRKSTKILPDPNNQSSDATGSKITEALLPLCHLNAQSDEEDNDVIVDVQQTCLHDSTCTSSISGSSTTETVKFKRSQRKKHL